MKGGGGGWWSVCRLLGGRQHECVFRWVSNMYTYVEHHLERSFVCRCLVTVIGPRAFSCTCVRLTYLKVPTLESLIGPISVGGHVAIIAADAAAVTAVATAAATAVVVVLVAAATR